MLVQRFHFAPAMLFVASTRQRQKQNKNTHENKNERQQTRKAKTNSARDARESGCPRCSRSPDGVFAGGISAAFGAGFGQTSACRSHGCRAFFSAGSPELPGFSEPPASPVPASPAGTSASSVSSALPGSPVSFAFPAPSGCSRRSGSPGSFPVQKYIFCFPLYKREKVCYNYPE